MSNERRASGDAGQPGLRRWSDTAPTPWRNGGGVTRELAGSPEGDGAFDWRISIADVTASGQFSSFPGVDRTIVLVDGPELTLTVAGTAHGLARHRPFDFDGGLPVSCSVPCGGPARALNVMTRRGRCRADVDVVDLDTRSAYRLPGRPTQLVICLTGRVRVAGADGREVVLDRFDLYRPPPAADLVLTGDGCVAHLELHQER